MSVSAVARHRIHQSFRLLIKNAPRRSGFGQTTFSRTVIQLASARRLSAAYSVSSSVDGFKGASESELSYSRNTKRFFSSSSAAIEDDSLSNNTSDEDSPTGDLFEFPKDIGPSLVGKTASIRRVFGPRANSEAMLTCGGEVLAAHASFDPNYSRAQGWIRQHAVGPAVLSPVLISGLTGALVEAAFPEAVPDSQSMKQLQPLIVGVSINARIEVVNVVDNRHHCEDEANEKANVSEGSSSAREYGYKVNLKTSVTRVRDDLVIAEGSHSIFIPDYRRM